MIVDDPDDMLDTGTVAGLKDTVGPEDEGVTAAARFTFPEKPFWLVRVMVVEPVEP